MLYMWRDGDAFHEACGHGCGDGFLGDSVACQSGFNAFGQVPSRVVCSMRPHVEIGPWEGCGFAHHSFWVRQIGFGDLGAVDAQEDALQGDDLGFGRGGVCLRSEDAGVVSVVCFCFGIKISQAAVISKRRRYVFRPNAALA